MCARDERFFFVGCTETTSENGTGAGNTGGTEPGMCDLFAQDCGAEERCSALFTFDDEDNLVDVESTCLSSAGTVGVGQACDGIDITPNELADNCDAGLFCAVPNNGVDLECMVLCDADTINCGEDRYCLGFSIDPVFGLCENATNCDLVEQTGCGEGQGCYQVTGDNGDILGDCFDFIPPQGGAGAVGEECSFLGDCMPGADCYQDPDNPAIFTCQAFCDGEAAVDTCDSGLQCEPIPTDGEIRVPTPPGVCR